MKRVYSTRRSDIINFGPRACIRITVVDPIFYDAFALFGACVLADQIVSVSEPKIVSSKANWKINVDKWVTALQKSELSGIVDVLCIKTTDPADTWKVFVDTEEEAKQVADLTKRFEKTARIKGVDLNVFPYGPNKHMLDNIQDYIEEIKKMYN